MDKTSPANQNTNTTIKLSNYTDALLKAYESKAPPKTLTEQQSINVSRTVSFFAFWYEKMRNAIEYREDHLIRRAAIERILKRRLLFNEQGQGVAEPLIKELLWARYLTNSSIPETKIDTIHQIIQKYLYIRRSVYPGRPYQEQLELDTFITNLLSCEIEETLAYDHEREAFINFVYQSNLPVIDFADKRYEQHKNILTYIATEQGFSKSDLPLVEYHLVKLLLPDLTRVAADKIESILPHFIDVHKQIKWATKARFTDRARRYIKRNSPPYFILRDLIEDNTSQARHILTDLNKLRFKVDEICRKKYSQTSKKLTRAGIRSIIYIFLTKMIFAILLEYPIDKYLIKRVDYMALGINIIFPPALMFLGVMLTNIPGADNTKRIFERLVSIINNDPRDDVKYVVKADKKHSRPFLMFGFSLVYLLAFVISFGLIFTGLTYLKFSIASQAIFIFFVSMVLFFTYRIRQTAKEYLLINKEGLLTPIGDFFMLPVLSLGKWLSSEISKINILIFIFDFIIEAPFKAIFEIAEEWVSFVRNKKEEII